METDGHGSIVLNRVSSIDGDVKNSAKEDCKSDPPSTEENSPAANSACKKCCSSLSACCTRITRPCMRTSHPMSTEPTRRERCKDAFLCPPHGKLAKYVTLAVMGILTWATLWSLIGKDALPGGNFFGLVVLVAACLLGGALVQLIKLPPLLGMLIVGLMLRNVPYINVAKDINGQWASSLRNVALVVILTRAGLGLDPVALRKLSMVVIRLAFMPCIFESVTVAVAANLLLGFPWSYGFMLGFVLAAVSPAIVVPGLLGLQERGFGLDKGVPTLVIAAASIDDVLAISGFGVVLGITFSKGNIVLTIFRGPLEALAGVLYGLLGGIFLWYFPYPAKQKNKTLYRFILLFTGGLFSVFGSQAAEIPGAGALGVLTVAFVAGLRWRKEGSNENEDERGFGLDKGVPTLVISAASIDDVLAISGFGVVLGITFSKVKNSQDKVMITGTKPANCVVFAHIYGSPSFLFIVILYHHVEIPRDPVSKVFATSWIIFQPLLFGLIGAEIDVLTIQPATIGLGVAVLGIGLVIRSLVAFLVVFKAGLNLKEKLFIPLAWLPKATVQAAIGSVALDTAKSNNLGPKQIQLGVQVLTIAVLVILVTAPIGAALIALTGPRLLSKSEKDGNGTSAVGKNGPVEEGRSSSPTRKSSNPAASEDELEVQQNLV